MCRPSSKRSFWRTRTTTGRWKADSEVTVGYKDVEHDDRAFCLEDLRPVPPSPFESDCYLGGRARFTREGLTGYHPPVHGRGADKGDTRI